MLELNRMHWGIENRCGATNITKTIRWFSFNEAIDKIAYDDIGKLILIGMKKIRDAGL